MLVNFLLSHYADKNYSNKINLSDIKGARILLSSYSSNLDTLYWTHSLASDFELYHLSTDFLLYYSKKNNFYNLCVLLNSDSHALKECIQILLKNNNFIHYIAYGPIDINFIEKELNNDIDKKLKYSFLLNNGEKFNIQNSPFIKTLKNISFIFSGSSFEFYKDLDNKEWYEKNKSKIILDYKYTFIYFYFKNGYCWLPTGDYSTNLFERSNKVFLYTKNYGKKTERFEIINKACNTNRVVSKEFSDKEVFYFSTNRYAVETSFFYDYNCCKFNLIMESNPPSINVNEQSNFVSEKTLKGLLVSTPAYILLTPSIYKKLSDEGYYFLNKEFGNYSDLSNSYNWKDNYNNFISFLMSSTDNEIDNLFRKSLTESKKNKILVEEYIYSDKIKEINLLFS